MYAQTAFQVDEEHHQKLMNKARKEKPPIVLLNVHLLEARNLIAKDINGEFNACQCCNQPIICRIQRSLRHDG